MASASDCSVAWGASPIKTRQTLGFVRENAARAGFRLRSLVGSGQCFSVRRDAPPSTAPPSPAGTRRNGAALGNRGGLFLAQAALAKPHGAVRQ
jgi:hypothetical protein